MIHVIERYFRPIIMRLPVHPEPQPGGQHRMRHPKHLQPIAPLIPPDLRLLERQPRHQVHKKRHHPRKVPHAKVQRGDRIFAAGKADQHGISHAGRRLHRRIIIRRHAEPYRLTAGPAGAAFLAAPTALAEQRFAGLPASLSKQRLRHNQSPPFQAQRRQPIRRQKKQPTSSSPQRGTKKRP